MFVLIFRCEAFDGQRGVSDSELGENRRSPNWHSRRQFWIMDWQRALHWIALAINNALRAEGVE